MRSSANILNKYRFIISGLNTLLVAGLAYLIEFDKTSAVYTDWPPLLLEFLEWLQSYSFIIICFSIVFWIIYHWKISGEKEWETIRLLLGYIRNKVFQNTNGDPKHYHRVTLFEFKAYLWRYGYITNSFKNMFRSGLNGWLVPVCRAGHLTQKSHAVFAVHDTGRVEGVCGVAWSTCEVNVVSMLPRVLKDTNDNLVQKYAEITNCSMESLRTRIIRTGLNNSKASELTLPRSIGAIPAGLGVSGGAPKYVLVLDSRDGEGVPENIGDQYSVVLQLLEHLLEGNRR